MINTETGQSPLGELRSCVKLMWSSGGWASRTKYVPCGFCGRKAPRKKTEDRVQ